MDEEALKDAHKLFLETGYKGDLAKFKNLISTNPNALKDAHQLFVNTGYNKSIDDFSTLVGVKKKVPSTSTSTTPSQNLVSGKKVGSSGTAKQNNKAELDKLFARPSSKESEKNLEVSYNKVLKNKPLVNKPIKEVNREEIAVPTKVDKQILPETKKGKIAPLPQGFQELADKNLSNNIDKWKEKQNALELKIRQDWDINTGDTDDDKRIALEETEAQANTEGVWNNIKKYGQDAINIASAFNPILLSSLVDSSDPIKDEKEQHKEKLIKQGIKEKDITEEELVKGAKDILYNKKINNIRLNKYNDYLDNLPEEEKEILTKNIQKEKLNRSDRDKYYIDLLDMHQKDIEILNSRMDDIVKKYNNKQPLSEQDIDFYKNYKIKGEALKNQYETTYNSFNKNRTELGDIEQEFDAVKRDYTMTGAFKRFIMHSANIGTGLLTFANMGSTNPASLVTELELAKVQKKINEGLQEKFRKTPDDVIGLRGGINYIGDLITDQAPNIILSATTGGATPYLIGASSTGNQFNDMVSTNLEGKTNYTKGQMYMASLGIGLANSIEFGTVKQILKGKNLISTSLSSNQLRPLLRETIKERAKNFTVKTSKGIGTEILEEDTTELITNGVKKFILKEDVDLTDNLLNVTKDSGVMGFVFQTFPHIFVASVKPLMKKDYVNRLDENAKEIYRLTKELDNINISDESKSIIQNNLNLKLKDNKDIIDNVISSISGLSIEQKTKVLELENSTSKLREEAKNISNNKDLSKETKQASLNSLKEKYLKEEDLRTKIIEGKTTILDVVSPEKKDEMKSNALNVLLSEKEGSNEDQFTNDVIEQKAIELHNQSNNNQISEPTETNTSEQVTEEIPTNNQITPAENVSPVENIVSPEVVNPTLEEVENEAQAQGDLGSLEKVEYEYFVNNNNVSDERLFDIAEKVKKGDRLTPYENSVFIGKTTEINKIIANESISEGDSVINGNIRPSDAVVDQDGSANNGDKQGGVQQPTNLQGNNGQEIVLDDVANFLKEQFGAEKPAVNPTPSPEVVKEIEPKAVKVEEAPKQTKAQQAKGFVSMATNSLATSLKDFQGRSKEYSEQTYNRIVNEAKEGILNISSIPPIQIWRNPDTGKFTILAGHSRTKAFSDLASGKVEFSDKYKKSDFENINSQIVEAETLEEAQKIAQESNQGAVQTVVDNAKYVRESLLPTFKNFNQAKTKLKSLYGSAWARIYAYANLNPKGKAMQMLKQFQDSNESDSDDKSKRIAEWTGKARNEFENLTDAHENEIFDYLLKNDKVKTYAELSELLNRRVNGLEEFNPNEPLNFEQKVGRGSNEVEIVKQIQDLKSRDAQIKKTIKDLQSFGKNLNDTQRQQIKDLTAESIKINTVDIPNAQKKQKQARAADAEQFDIFSQINEQVENGNITPEQVDEFVNDDRKAEEIEPIVEVIESKAKGYNKAELEEVVAEVDAVLEKGIEDVSVFNKGIVLKTKEGNTVDVTSFRKVNGKIIGVSGRVRESSILGKESLLSDQFTVEELSKLENYVPLIDEGNIDKSQLKQDLTEDYKQQLKDKANAEVDKIADKIKGLLPSIKDPNLKNQGIGQDQLIDLIASAVKNLVSAGIDINEAIKQVVDSVKAKFGDIDIDIEAVKERISPKQKVTQQPIINTQSKQQEKKEEPKSKSKQRKPIDKNEIKEGSFEDLVGNLPKTGNKKESEGAGTITKLTEDIVVGDTTYDEIGLLDTFAHSNNYINVAVEQFGDEFVSKVLDYIENHQLKPNEIAFAYIALENKLRQFLEANPKDLTTKKQLDLVRKKRIAYMTTIGQAMNAPKLQNLAYYGYDASEITDMMFTQKERTDRKKLSEAIETDIDAIQKQEESFDQYEEEIEEIDSLLRGKRNEDVKAKKAELAKDINKIKEDIKKKLNDLKNKGLKSSFDAGITEKLIAISPEILKLAKLYAKSTNLSTKQIIDNIHDDFKDVIDGLKKKDIIEVLQKDLQKESNKKPKKEKSEEEILQDKLDKRTKQLENRLAELKENKAKDNTGKSTVWNEEISGLQNQIKSLKDLQKESNKKPNYLSVVKKALVDAGFGKEITVNTKNGKEQRVVFDWKKLVGDELSIDNIQKHVEETLLKQGYSQEQIDAISNDLQNQYNNLHADIINKKANEINRRNTKHYATSRNNAYRLAELYNLGLFEDQRKQFDNIFNSLLGTSKLDQDTFDTLTEMANGLAKIQKENIGFFGKKLDKDIIDKINKIVNKYKVKKAPLGFKVTDIIDKFLGLSTRMILHSMGQMVSNSFSGLSAVVRQGIYNKLTGKSTNKELRKRTNKIANATAIDIALNSGSDYGDVDANLSRNSSIEDFLNGKTNNKVAHGLVSAFFGKVHLNMADSYFKSILTNGKLHQALMIVATDPSNPNRMTKKEAKNYITEKITGTNWDNAIEKAKEIVEKVNSEKNLVSGKKENITRIAEGLVLANLLDNKVFSPEMIESAYKSAYTSAGFDLGHESNNIVTTMVNKASIDLSQKYEKALQEEKYGLATINLLAKSVFSNFIKTFVGGGTNWAILTAQSTGLDIYSLIKNNIEANSNKIDLSEEGLKNLENALKRKLNARSTNTRMAIGASISTAMLLAYLGSDDDDDDENAIKKTKKWLEENKWAKPYFSYVAPSSLAILVHAGEEDGKESSKETLKILGVKDPYFEDNYKIGKAIKLFYAGKKDEALVEMNKFIGSKANVPLPWRTVRDIEKIYRGLNGMEEIKPNYKTKDPTDALFVGGFSEWIGLIDTKNGEKSKESKSKSKYSKF